MVSISGNGFPLQGSWFPSQSNFWKNLHRLPKNAIFLIFGENLLNFFTDTNLNLKQYFQSFKINTRKNKKMRKFF